MIVQVSRNPDPLVFEVEPMHKLCHTPRARTCTKVSLKGQITQGSGCLREGGCSSGVIAAVASHRMHRKILEHAYGNYVRAASRF